MSQEEEQSQLKNPINETIIHHFKRRMLISGIILLICVLVIAAYMIQGQNPDPIFLITLQRLLKAEELEKNKSERYWIAIVRHVGEKPLILTESFFSASSPSVSFDGKYILFSGIRKQGDKRAIWEMSLYGSRAKLITEGVNNPDYPAYMPDGSIVFSDNPDKGSETGRRSLFSYSSDTEKIIRLTYGNSIDSRPEILPDGRIMFERSISGQPSIRLTIRPDGTQVSQYLYSSEISKSSFYKEEIDDYIVVNSKFVFPKPVPPILPSVVNPSKTTGTMFCLNVYDSNMPSVKELSTGMIDRVRVSRTDVLGESPEAVLGDAPIMEDGSFFIEIPADTPLQLTLLSKNGSTIAVHRSGIWVRPNENRGCVGCHEDPYLAPENRQPMAVKFPPIPLYKKTDSEK